MPTHHASTKRTPTPASVATHAAMTSKASEEYSAYGARMTQRKGTIADLVDDQSALDDWHRNLARLRANSKD